MTASPVFFRLSDDWANSVRLNVSHVLYYMTKRLEQA